MTSKSYSKSTLAGMSTSRRFALLFTMLVAVVAGGWLLKARFLTDPTSFITASAKIGDIEDTVLASGTLKPIKMVAIGSQVSGRVTSLKVWVGQNVKQGDLIAEIDPVTRQNDLRTAEAAQEAVRAQRAEKEATLALAQASLARQQLTFEQKASSRADFESAEATVGQTKAQISALDAQITEAIVAVESARVNLAYTRITAPINGTVLSIVTQEGQTVNAVQSAPTIVIVGQVDVMTIRAEISEVDVIKVKPGQTVYFTILGDPDHRYDARFDAIEPAPESIKNDSSFSSSASSSTNTSSTSSTTSAIYYIGILNVPNKDGLLRTYMTAEVHIVVAQAKGVLTIPSAALSHRNEDGTYLVQVIENNGAVRNRQVKICLDNKITAEVCSGLNDGDRVVVHKASPVPEPTQGPPGGLPPGF